MIVSEKAVQLATHRIVCTRIHLAETSKFVKRKKKVMLTARFAAQEQRANILYKKNQV